MFPPALSWSVIKRGLLVSSLSRALGKAPQIGDSAGSLKVSGSARCLPFRKLQGNSFQGLRWNVLKQHIGR
ncbi:hypothetical protein B0T11DRAFT_277943 [Plectosphaerella cucumerina]|uniref:Uncharacterized protein n=1 Tax=Plectosphaerella cucumerina TaxID=40658 RepID=A0A8K0TQL9_9PEZI|nr:hypothetical protein B0T11DRAFT_277943 [Plectosphaerella cucumerina]